MITVIDNAGPPKYKVPLSQIFNYCNCLAVFIRSGGRMLGSTGAGIPSPPWLCSAAVCVSCLSFLSLEGSRILPAGFSSPCC